MMRPCLECGRPTSGRRCGRCSQMFETARNRAATVRRQAGVGARRPYDAEYRRAAAEVRATAVVCWLCGGGVRPDDPWQADHVVAGDYGSELRAAHRSCNIGRANKGRSARSAPKKWGKARTT